MDAGRVLDILSRLVRFDTTSRNSNLQLVDWVEDYLKGFGVRSERIYDPTGQKANVFASVGPTDVPGFILSGHTDVVPVDGQTWSSDPFRLRQADGRLYGRGACDMKGFLAVCLAAVERMRTAPLRRPIHLALSYDEEVGCVGGRRLAEHLSSRPMRQQGCFVGEPTSMAVVIGHKSKRTVRATVRGKGGHSALAPLGVNAVEYGARLVTEISRIGGRLASEGPRDDLYDVPHSTAHVGVMHGGTAINIVPDHAEILFEFRTIGGVDPDQLVAEVIRYAGEVSGAFDESDRPERWLRFRRRLGLPRPRHDAGRPDRRLDEGACRTRRPCEGGVRHRGRPFPAHRRHSRRRHRPRLDRAGAQARRVDRDGAARRLRGVRRPARPAVLRVKSEHRSPA